MLRKAHRMCSARSRDGRLEAGESKSRIQKELGGLNLEWGVVYETGGIYNVLFANYAIE